MANGNKNEINFKLNFQLGDKKAFDQLKNQFSEIRQIASDLTLGLDTKTMQSTLHAANTLEQALNRAYDPVLNTINIQKFNQILKQGGVDAKTLQANLANAGAVGQQAFLGATAQLMKFNTATKQTNQFLDSIATSLFNTIKLSAMSSIVNNISGAVQKSYYYVKDLDRALNDIRIVTGKSAEDMADFAVQANNAAKALAVTTEDYTQGSLIYYQQGLDDETVKALTDITAKTSNVTGQAMGTVSEELTAVLNGYQVANQAAREGMQVYEEYVDKMAAVGASTASDLQELSTAMSKVASAASSMGVDFDDLNAQIATIVSVTRQAPESVGTALKTIYARLGDLKVDGVDEFGTKLGEVTANLQTMGINILDQQGNMRKMTDVMTEVAEKLDTWTSAQRQAAAVAMAGKRQYNNLIALFDNWDRYGEALEISMNAAGTLEKQQEIAMDSLANKMDVLKATAEDLYDSLFNTDTISNFLEKGTDVLQFLADFADSVGGLNNILPMLLFTMTQLFSKQIANGLGTIINNFKTFGNEAKIAEQNAAQLKMMFADSSLIAQMDSQGAVGQAAKEGFKELETYYREMQKYQHLMTEEEKKQYNEILKNIDAVGQKRVEIEEEKEAWRRANDSLKLMDASLIDDVDRMGELNEEAARFQKFADNLKTVDIGQVVENSQKLQLDGSSKKINRINQIINDMRSQVGNPAGYSGFKISDIFPDIQEFQSFADAFEKQLEKIKGRMTLTDEEINKIVQRFKVLEKETGSTSSAIELLSREFDRINSKEYQAGDATDYFERKIRDIAKDFGELKTKTKDGKSELDKIIESFRNSVSTGTSADAAYKEVIKRLEQLGIKSKDVSDGMQQMSGTMAAAKTSAESLKEGLKVDQIIQNITSTVSALGQLAMAINTLKNIGSILENEDLDTGDKILQTVTSLSFVISGLSSGFLSLGKVFTEYTALGKMVAAIDSLITATKGTNISITQILKGEITKEALALEIAKKKAREYVATHGGASSVLTTETIATINDTAAKEAEVIMTEKATIAQEKLNLTILKNPYILILGVIIAGIAAVTKAYIDQQKAIEENIKARQQERKELEEAHNARRQEIKDNQQLAQSLIDLYEQYKKGTTSKETLTNKTDELKDVLGEEAVAVATLTGNYESLNQQMLEYRQNKIIEKQQQNKEESDKALQNIKGQDQRISSNSQFLISNQTATAINANKELSKLFTVEGDESGTNNLINFNSDILTKENANELISAYSELIKVADSLDKDIINGLLRQGILDNIAIIDSANDDDEILNVQSQLINQNNLANIKTYEEYERIIQSAEDMLKETSQYKDKGANEIYSAAVELVRGLSGNNKDFETRSLATQDIINKYQQDFTNEDFRQSEQKIREFADKLSQEELAVLLSGKVVIDKDSSEEDIKKQIDIISSQLKDEGSLEIVASLRTKLTSGKKLTKKELEEAMGEESQLAEQYIDFHDFENQSELEQIKSINAVGEAEIKSNNERLQSAEEYAKQRLEYIDRFQKANQKELLEYKQLKDNEATLNDDQIKRYKELNEIFEQYIQEKEELNEIIKNHGYGFEEIDTTIFDNLITGIDGVISEAEVLKSLAEDIGENLTIAADKVERFGKNFPDIVANQENYNFLQDGSLQLTEQGQQALQDFVNTQKEEIIGKYQAYRAEVEKNAELHKTTAEYYKSQADLLDKLLVTKGKGVDLEAGMQENLANYQQDLANTVAKDDARAKNKIMDNALIAATNAQKNTQSMYEYLCAVGQTIQAVAEAETSGKFNPPPGPDGQASPYGGGGTLSTEGINKTTLKDIKNVSEEEVTQLRDYFLEMYQEEMNKYSTEESKLMGIDAAINAANNAMDRAASGKGGKDSKSSKSGSSKDKDKDQKELEDEFDRYWQIKKAIDTVDHSIKILEKDQANLHGKSLINSLNQENLLIAQQTANYKQLYEMQKEEAEELHQKLSPSGVNFDDNGAITNYKAATVQAMATYANAINEYNSGVLDEAGLKIAEKSYENFKKALERYDKLYYSEMVDTQDKIDDNNRKQIANNLKGLETNIKIRLDTTKALRDLYNFMKDVQQDFRKVNPDLMIDVKYNKASFDTFVRDLDVTIGSINEVETEINKMADGGTSVMFNDISEAQERLKELNEQLLEQGKSLYDLYKEIWQSYIDGIDQVKDNFDELMKRYDHFTNTLDYHRELIELLYGDKAFDLMDKYYTAQNKNLDAQIDSVKQQANMWQSEFEKSYELARKTNAKVNKEDFTTLTEDMKKAYENMIDSQEKLNDLITEAVKLLQDKYLNTVNKIADTMDKNIWGKDGFEGIKSNWEFMQKMADEYLDDVEGKGNIQLFANRMDMDKANTTNLKTQQKIQAFRDREIAYLREKKNLTQDDLDIEEALYDILLKEAALEDVQNNKTSMKLTRNEQGNLSYQYIADEEDVGQKQQDLLQSYVDLYKMADDANKHALELAQDMQQSYAEAWITINQDMTLSEEEKVQKLQELYDQYYPYIIAAAQNAEIYKQEAMMASSGVFGLICEQDAAAYDSLTQTQKNLVDELKNKNFEDYNDMRVNIIEGFYPDLNAKSKETYEELNMNSQTLAADVIKKLVTDPKDSVKAHLIQANKDVIEATKEYENEITALEELAGVKFGEVGKDIDEVSKKIEGMEGTTKQMVQNSSKMLDKLREAVRAVSGSLDGLIGKITDAHNRMRDFAEMARIASSIAAAVTGDDSKIPDIEIPDKIDKDGSGDGGSTSGVDKTKKESNYTKGGKTLADKGYSLQLDPYGSGKQSNVASGKVFIGNRLFDNSEQNLVGIKGPDGEYVLIGDPEDANKELSKLIKKTGAAGFGFEDINKYGYASGGYTGTLNDTSGRLAFLHQKELVLNKDDTANFLSGINMIRDMTSLNGSISNAITNAVANMVLTLSGVRAGANSGSVPVQTSTSADTYNITAEFPNANDVNEIREAILSLPNLASQYKMQNGR